MRLPFKPQQIHWSAADSMLYVLADNGRKLLRFLANNNTGALTRLDEKKLITPILDLAVAIVP